MRNAGSDSRRNRFALTDQQWGRIAPLRLPHGRGPHGGRADAGGQPLLRAGYEKPRARGTPGMNSVLALALGWGSTPSGWRCGQHRRSR